MFGLNDTIKRKERYVGGTLGVHSKVIEEECVNSSENRATEFTAIQLLPPLTASIEALQRHIGAEQECELAYMAIVPLKGPASQPQRLLEAS